MLILVISFFFSAATSMRWEVAPGSKHCFNCTTFTSCSLQSALNCAGDGDEISLASGNYYGQEPLRISRKSLRIIGAAKSQTVLVVDGDYALDFDVTDLPSLSAQEEPIYIELNSLVFTCSNCTKAAVMIHSRNHSVATNATNVFLKDLVFLDMLCLDGSRALHIALNQLSMITVEDVLFQNVITLYSFERGMANAMIYVAFDYRGLTEQNSLSRLYPLSLSNTVVRDCSFPVLFLVVISTDHAVTESLVDSLQLINNSFSYGFVLSQNDVENFKQYADRSMLNVTNGVFVDNVVERATIDLEVDKMNIVLLNNSFANDGLPRVVISGSEEGTYTFENNTYRQPHFRSALRITQRFENRGPAVMFARLNISFCNEHHIGGAGVDFYASPWDFLIHFERCLFENITGNGAIHFTDDASRKAIDNRPIKVMQAYSYVLIVRNCTFLHNFGYNFASAITTAVDSDVRSCIFRNCSSFAEIGGIVLAHSLVKRFLFSDNLVDGAEVTKRNLGTGITLLSAPDELEVINNIFNAHTGKLINFPLLNLGLELQSPARKYCDSVQAANIVMNQSVLTCIQGSFPQISSVVEFTDALKDTCIKPLSSLQVACEGCPKSTYARKSASHTFASDGADTPLPSQPEGLCRACPLGAKCDGGNSKVFPITGFYSNEALLGTAEVDVSILNCAYCSCIAAGHDNDCPTSGCTLGHIGPLCGECAAPDYVAVLNFQGNLECRSRDRDECNDTWLIAGSAVAFCIAVAFVIYQIRPRRVLKMKYSGLLHVVASFATFYQAIKMCKPEVISQRQTSSSTPDFASFLAAIADIFSVDYWPGGGLGCIDIRDNSALVGLAFRFLPPLCLWTVFLLCAAVVYSKYLVFSVRDDARALNVDGTHDSQTAVVLGEIDASVEEEADDENERNSSEIIRSHAHYRVVAALFAVFNVTFAAIVNVSLEMLHCVPVPYADETQYRLFQAGAVQCLKRWQIPLILLLLIYLFLPAVIEIARRKHARRKENEPSRSAAWLAFIETVSSPFAGSPSSAWYSLSLYFRLVILAVAVLIPNRWLRSTLVSLIIWFSFALLTWFQPYRTHRAVNNFAILSHLVVAIISLMTITDNYLVYATASFEAFYKLTPALLFSAWLMYLGGFFVYITAFDKCKSYFTSCLLAIEKKISTPDEQEPLLPLEEGDVQ